MRINYIIPRILQTLVWIPTRIVLILLARFKVNGQENIKDLKGGVIFASNHSSEVDPILLPAAIPAFCTQFPMFYVARQKGFYRKQIYGGLLFRLWGAYPAYAGYNNYSKSLMHHIKILGSRHSVLIFPEGKKTIDGNVQEHAHGGVAYLAKETGKPVVPVFMKGTFNTSVWDFLIRRKSYSVTFGKPIYDRELFGDKENPNIIDHKNAAKDIMDKVAALAG